MNLSKWQTAEAERSLLCAILARPSNIEIAASEVVAADFSHEQSGVVYSSLLSLWTDEIQIDTTTLSDRLTSGGMEQARASALVRSLANYDLDFGAPSLYAKRIRGAARERRIRTQIHEAINDTSRPVDDLLVDLMAKVENDAIGEEPVSARDVARDAIAQAQDAFERRQNGQPPGIVTGLTRLDAVLGGLGPGELVVIGGATSVGKSSLMLAAAANQAKKGVRVGYISLEDTANTVGARIVSRESRFPLVSFNTGEIEGSEFTRIGDGTSRFAEWPIWFYFDGNLTASEVARRMRVLKMRHNVEVIYVDYLQEIQDPPGQNYGNRHVSLSSATTVLKATAKRIGVPLVLGSQLTKDADGRKPSKRDLKESGDIANKAERVLLLWNDDGNMWIIVAKNKNGPCVDVQVSFVGLYASIENLEGRYDGQ